MELISWNVNGIRAILKKNFLDFVKKETPDILCIQETKAHPDQVDEMLNQYPHHYWNSAEKKGYAGTAVFSKIQPESVQYGIGKEEHDKEGRVIVIEFAEFYLVNVYVPNSGKGLPRLPYREKWDHDFLVYLKKLEKSKHVIVCGDLNVAHTELDLANPKNNYNKTAGYTQKEIDGFQKFIDAGFIDTFRLFTKSNGHYTYWGFWNNLRARNIGWRIDYFLVSKLLVKKVKKSTILTDIMGSDHCPIKMIL